MKIRPYCDKDFETLKKIFWLNTSAQISSEMKAEFEIKYLTYYLSNYADFSLVAVDVEDNVLGYIIGAPDTLGDLFFLKNFSYLQSFTHLMGQFPAHLHINLAQSSQGLGLGSILIQHFCDGLANKVISGVHLITNKDARNVSFYQKNNFKLIAQAGQLVMLGKIL
jgi:ribosomal protein S18 acetylase RimI-like enzyme